MIIIKTKKEIEIMKEGGNILAEVMRKLTKEVKPGITTGYLEKMACDLISKAGGRPSFKGYKAILNAKGFPTALCASINDEVVHGPALPSRELKNGDIIGLDLGMEYPKKNGYYTDMAVTAPVGKINKEIKKLINTTKKSLELAIKQVKPGNNLNDIGRAIQKCAEENGFSVVRDLVGHGVGTDVHEEPQIPNYEIFDNSLDNVVLKEGMTIAIEPMINIGDYKIKCAKDGFTILTKDESISAHFEHTVAVTENGHKILTL